MKNPVFGKTVFTLKRGPGIKQIESLNRYHEKGYIKKALPSFMYSIKDE